MADDLQGKYLKAVPLKVKHALLKKFGSTESPFRKLCPKCEKGVLMVNRDQESLVVINVDRCTHCGQSFVYTDQFIGGEPVHNVVQNPS